MDNSSTESDELATVSRLNKSHPGFLERLRSNKRDEINVEKTPEQPERELLQRQTIKPSSPSLIKRVERFFSGLVKVGRNHGAVKDLTRELEGAHVRLDALTHDLRHTQQSIENEVAQIGAASAQVLSDAEIRRVASAGVDQSAATLHREIGYLRTELSETKVNLQGELAATASEQASQSRAYTDLTRRLDLQRMGGQAPEASEAPSGLDALLETFYARLEDRYRGSREEITRRLLKYLPDAEATTERTSKPVLDLGCGRGEWLEILRQRGVEAVGIDLNEMQLHEARALGLSVHLGDACRFLAEAEDSSYGMVTAHHLIEHLPFETVVWMTREVMRVLAPGGVLLYETPNVRNIVVGASSFHVDPTHKTPLPVEVLETVFDTIGFFPVETRFLHTHPKYDELVREKRLDPEIAGLLFGPQDLAVLGTKPDGST